MNKIIRGQKKKKKKRSQIKGRMRIGNIVGDVGIQLIILVIIVDIKGLFFLLKGIDIQGGLKLIK